jgi:hypothetical protein
MNIEELDIDVLESRAIIGFEVGFNCPGCGKEFYCILTPGSFVEAPKAESTTEAEPDASVTVTILSLVDITVDEAVVHGLSDEQRLQAIDWASAVHAEAGDHVGVEIPPMPEFLEEHQGSPFLEVT